MTIIGNNIIIDVVSDGHHITVTGNNNTITVGGSGNKFRIQGTGNYIAGRGEGRQVGIFSLNPVIFKNIAVQALRDEFAPIMLTTGGVPWRDCRPAKKNVRYAYRARQGQEYLVRSSGRGVKRAREDDHDSDGNTPK